MKKLTTLATSVVLAGIGVAAHADNVLVVLSDSDHLDLNNGKVFSTGFYFNELLQPVKLLLDAGHHVTFATPQGKAPTLDRSSVDKMYFNNDPAQLQRYQTLLAQLNITSATDSPVISLARVEQIGLEKYDALYIPGGHAPMQDLLTSAPLGRVLTHFHDKGKTTALVCHGPIALLSTLPDAQGFVGQLATKGQASAPSNWIYAGYKMTVISNQEEELAKGLLGDGSMKFYPQTALQQAGGQYSSNTSPWTSHVVTDRELITGQNPASALAVGQALVERLKP
ncbi:Putative intracellular protease/amidase [Pseudomonas sp. NFACC24-1]|uniref:type 1 glutamine amidotransferase domain-containing protein n=1 Tax=Pseudomonas sp. NFACC24-1 TaxID=1566189 RepID=UPI0008E064F4|nr:type 1 glutamine amidotransferase domain-containing protein [Pseudomonas sp. NFACC24-1]SFN55233.1 Putative intracellular protease/amidase [Pseudomonas sp. NFACC24-1]